MDIELKGIIDGKETTLTYRRNDFTYDYFNQLIFFGIFAFSFLYIGISQAWPYEMNLLFWKIPNRIFNYILIFLGSIGVLGVITVIHDYIKRGD